MNIEFDWKQLPSLPSADGQTSQPGLAGAITGLIADELLMAGGSNFPDTLPWLGGTKTYYDEIYSLNLKDTAAGWKLTESRLREPLAYASCISIGGEIYSVGGENRDGTTSQVFKISKKNEKFVIDRQTNFPIAVSNTGIAAVGRVIYVVGGITGGRAISSFYAANTADSSLTWEKLPDIPVALSHAVVLSQRDEHEPCIYVLGGRNKTGVLTEFFSAIWKYAPAEKKWSRVGDITNSNGGKITLAAGTGAAYGKNKILIFGGDTGELFNKTEDFIHRISIEKDGQRKRELIQQKNAHLSSHPGFCRDIFQFNTITGKCSDVGRMPYAAQVTTTAVRRGNEYIIPDGEIKPGVRTPEVTCVKVIAANE